MSSVAIPAAAAPGQLTVDIQLNPDDQQTLLYKLQSALERARGAPATATPPLAAAPAAPTYAAPPPLPLPLLPGTAARPQPAAPQPERWQAAVPAASAAPAWQMCWTTDAADHSGQDVRSMAYLPQIAGLPGGDGHAGWLVSSSAGLLNLWECSPSAGRGEPALMCMHSQGSEYSPVCLDAERSTRLLLGAAADRSGNEWVTAFSLEADSLLTPQGRCPMPHVKAKQIPGQQCLAVTSLHGFGGPLAGTCVAAYGGGLVVWSVGSASKPAASNTATHGSAAPKALWKAHDALITCLHRSAHGLALYSGAADGSVHMFNMREKPDKPNAVFPHQGRVTGIYQLNDTELLTTAGDGTVQVWDVRNAAAGPVKFAVPDQQPILRMAVSPFSDAVAVATSKGLFSVDLLDAACTVTPIAQQLAAPVTALTWNTATSEVIVAGGPGAPGTLSVYKQRMGGY